MNKFNNIIKFVSLFLSGDLDLVQQSPDYIMEKFNLFFGEIKIKKHKITSKIYKKHNDIWKHNDYRINSILNFLIDVNIYSIDSELEIIYDGNGMYSSGPYNIKCKPEGYIELFNLWISDFSNIRDDDVGGLHTMLISDIYNIYLNSIKDDYSEFFIKLERKDKLLKIKKHDKE